MADGRPTGARGSWLVRTDSARPVPEEWRAWLPAALTAHPAFAGPDAADAVLGLQYVVVDELVDDTVGMDVCAWPYADANGRLRFPGGVLAHVGCDRAAVQAQLYGAGGRGVRVGDVFGARLTPSARRRLTAILSDARVRVARPDELIEGTLYDLSAAARTVGKLAYYGAMSDVIEERQARADNLMQLTRVAEPPSRVRHLPVRPTGESLP